MTGGGGPAGGPRTEVVAGPARASHRQRRARLVRWVLVGAEAPLCAGALGFLLVRAPGWAVLFAALAGLLGLGLAATAILGRKVVAVTVRGTSMEPTYRHGDRVLVRRGAALARGQVTVAELPPSCGRWQTPPLPLTAGAVAVSGRQWLIKRVVAVPGDPVPRDRAAALVDVPEERVPPGKVVLLGDNPDVSHDSRQIGYFPAERVLGAVLGRR